MKWGITLNIQTRRIAELKPAEYNPRKALTPEDAEWQKIKNANRPLDKTRTVC